MLRVVMLNVIMLSVMAPKNISLLLRFKKNYNFIGHFPHKHQRIGTKRETHLCLTRKLIEENQKTVWVEFSNIS